MTWQCIGTVTNVACSVRQVHAAQHVCSTRKIVIINMRMCAFCVVYIAQYGVVLQSSATSRLDQVLCCIYEEAHKKPLPTGWP